MKKDIFNPYIFVLVFVLFILLALPTYYVFNKLPTPSFQLYYYIILALICFVLGVLLANYLLKDYEFNESSDYLKNLGLLNNYSKLELILIGIVIVSLLLQIINFINLGGIPLFSGVLKSKAASKIWLISYILFLPGINILLAKFNRKTYYLLLVIGVLLFALTGYRTTPLSILLTSFITLYYTRDIDIKYQIIFLVLIFLVLVAVGFIAVQAIEWQHWSLNPLELLSYRAAFTLNILNKVILHQLATGGNLFYSTLTGFFVSVDPRVLVGQAVLGQKHSITSTILGPVLLDFGVFGLMIQMFFIGFILKFSHIIQKHFKSICTAFYSILLGQTLIWIETGPTDLVVWLFYLVGIIILIYYTYKLKHNKSL